MVLEKKKGEWKFGDEKTNRWIDTNEIVIEDLPEETLLEIQDNLGKVGYHSEYWKADKQESGHLHIKKIPHLEELDKHQLQKYKELFIKKNVPEEFWGEVDFQVCGVHRIATENLEHYKGYGVNRLIREVNPEKPNFCDKDLYDLVKKEVIQAKNVDDFKEIISEIVPKWISGKRQELALSLAGYLRKEKRVGIETAKSVILEVCKQAKDTSEIPMRLRAVEDTYKKDESEIKGYSGLKDIVNFEEIEEKKPTPQYKTKLEVLTYTDLKKFKANKNYIVETFLYPGSVTMLYGSPGSLKSINTTGMAFAIANGLDYLGMKTKKTPVLYLNGEESQAIMKEHAEKIHKGFRLKRNKFPLFFLQGGLLMDSKKNINLSYLVEVEELIKKQKIKVIIFDTLHRFCLYDENSSDDLNKLYTEVFKPLADELGVAIFFLHHATKTGGYRGSGDFLGMVDVSYRIERKGKTGEFKIINEKCRSGEIPEINGEVVFGEDYIRFNRLAEVQEQEDYKKKQSSISEKIEGMFEEDSKFSRKDIISFLDEQKFEYGSTRSVDRALKFLVEVKKVLDKTGQGVYSLIC